MYSLTHTNSNPYKNSTQLFSFNILKPTNKYGLVSTIPLGRPHNKINAVKLLMSGTEWDLAFANLSQSRREM